jgi:DNA (cytosine-5)-methyltransferase 1
MIMDQQNVNHQADLSAVASQVVISLFPGIGLLDRGFEAAGFTVLRGPDRLWGGDIRHFTPPRGVAAGVIGGPPCQDFSAARRDEPTGHGLAMLEEFRRCVLAADPDWWLMENVARVPDWKIPGYSWQRIDLRASEFGLRQSRLRHIQFGHRDNHVLTIARGATVDGELEPCALATEGAKVDRRSWADFCELQGLPRDFALPVFSRRGRYTAVGNGVPVPMAQALAEGILNLRPDTRACICSCGRPVFGRQEAAGPACRKRMQRRRDAAQQ